MIARLFILSLLCATFAIATIVPGQPDRLVWNPSPSTAVSYQVLRGPASNSVTATNMVGPATNYTILGVDFGSWWFAVRAVSTNGVFSDPTPSIPWTNNPDAPAGLRIQSSTNASILLWVPLPSGIAIVESAIDPAGSWDPFVQVKNLSVTPARELGVRVFADDPRRFYRVPFP